jgi:hypothetical protein
MASTTLIGTLGGVALTQWNQRRVYEQQALAARLSAIRENRSEQILKFMDAAQTVEEVAEERFYHEDKLPEGAAARVHQLWLCEKGVHIVGGEALRGAAKEYAKKLQDAVHNGTGGMEPHKYYEAERLKFLVAARSELGNGEEHAGVTDDEIPGGTQARQEENERRRFL